MEKQIEVSLNFDQDIHEHMSRKFSNREFQILSKSLDARKAPLGRKPRYLYKILLDATKVYDFSVTPKSLNTRPIIIGFGPAGMFAALRFMDYGIKARVFERGEDVQKRMLSIAKYWRYGTLDSESNVCYGEGGAGLFSDGKIYTRIKSDFIHYVLEKFVEAGADEKILYESNPHLGSHKIRKIIKRLTSKLQSFGSEINFNTSVQSLLIDNKKVIGVKLNNGEEVLSDHVILAAGHSAKNLYKRLHQQGVKMSKKDFALGVRIEHPRKYMDKMQFGEFAGKLGAATYRVTHHDHSIDIGTYSFCMCPGGYVLSSTTDQNTLVTNGMSNDSHNSPWSNAAIVVSVKSETLGEDVFSGFTYIEDIETKAYKVSSELASGKEMPAITLKEFLEDSVSDGPLPKSSVPSKLVKADFKKIFPDNIIAQLKIAFMEFDKKIKGFNLDNAILIAPETRTSSPIKIDRDKIKLSSDSTLGLYPCGEGAGYAGGITSAAVDGIKVVDSILS